MEQNTIKRFFTNTDETGKFMVTSNITGVKYFVEPIGDSRGGDWGSYNPSTGNIENKKGFDKYTGSVKIEDSIITEDNGFKNIKHLEVAESPMSEIDKRDKEYELKGLRKK